ncbi:hypothetical protein D3C80_2148010 [compost metagenome]
MGLHAVLPQSLDKRQAGRLGLDIHPLRVRTGIPEVGRLFEQRRELPVAADAVEQIKPLTTLGAP